MTAAPGRAVALAPTAPAQIASASEMLDALKAVQAAIAPDLNTHELRLFAMVAHRSGLDPFARQIHAVKRQGKVTFQTGIDGFRSVAERTGQYDGSDEPEFGPACSCAEAPKPHPEWARVTVYRIRDGERKPQSATAYWHEFKPAPGSSGNGDAMWKKMPRNQLAKCAEALSFRKAFPYVLADVYSPEEMDQARGDQVLEHRPTARQAVAARRAEVEGEADVSREYAADVVDGHATDVPADLEFGGTELAAAAEPEADVAGDDEPVVEALTPEAFMELVATTEGVTPEAVVEAARAIFPGIRNLAALSDEARGQLWAQVAKGAA